MKDRLKKWLNLTLKMGFFGCGDFLVGNDYLFSQSKSPPSQVQGTVNIAEFQPSSAEPTLDQKPFLDTRNNKNRAYYDYKVDIYLSTDEYYPGIRISQFIDYDKDYITLIMQPQLKEQHLSLARADYALKYTKTKLPALIKTQFETRLNQQNIPDIYGHLLECSPQGEHYQRLQDLKNQMLKDYCFSFHLGKQYNKIETKRQNFNLRQSDRQTKLYFLAEAQMNFIRLELHRLKADIIDNLFEMQNLVPEMRKIQKEDLDTYYSYQVYNAALEAFNTYQAQAEAAAVNAQRNQWLKRTKRALSIASLTFAGISVVGSLFTLW